MNESITLTPVKISGAAASSGGSTGCLSSNGLYTATESFVRSLPFGDTLADAADWLTQQAEGVVCGVKLGAGGGQGSGGDFELGTKQGTCAGGSCGYGDYNTVDYNYEPAGDGPAGTYQTDPGAPAEIAYA